MESFLFKADIDYGISLGGQQLFMSPTAIMTAADRLISRMRKGTIKRVVVKQKVFS
jgi:hypothetical protein